MVDLTYDLVNKKEMRKEKKNLGEKQKSNINSHILDHKLFYRYLI